VLIVETISQNQNGKVSVFIVHIVFCFALYSVH